MFAFRVDRVVAIYGTKVCWVGKHVNVTPKYYETDELPNSPRPTQPKKNRLKVTFGPLFPTSNIFSLGGVGFV